MSTLRRFGKQIMVNILRDIAENKIVSTNEDKINAMRLGAEIQGFIGPPKPPKTRTASTNKSSRFNDLLSH